MTIQVPVALVILYYAALPVGIVCLLFAWGAHGHWNDLLGLIGGILSLFGLAAMVGVINNLGRKKGRVPWDNPNLPPTERWPYTASPYYKKR